MSRPMWTFGPALMSELIHPRSGKSPHPQLSRRTPLASRSATVSSCAPAPCCRRVILDSAYPKVFQQPTDDAVGIEVLPREIPGRTRLPCVVAGDHLDRSQRLVGLGEGEQPGAGRVELGEPRLLRYHRAAGGEVAEASVADPSAAGADIHVLGDHQLGLRPLHVVLI